MAQVKPVFLSSFLAPSEIDDLLMYRKPAFILPQNTETSCVRSPVFDLPCSTSILYDLWFCWRPVNWDRQWCAVIVCVCVCDCVCVSEYLLYCRIMSCRVLSLSLLLLSLIFSVSQTHTHTHTHTHTLSQSLYLASTLLQEKWTHRSIAICWTWHFKSIMKKIYF